MLNAQDSQFRLMEDGRIFYQDNPTNPLPGAPLAQVSKGASVFRPAVHLPESELAKDQDRGKLHEHLEGWLSRHVAGILAPLAALGKDDEDLKGPAKGIAFQVHEALGIVPRAQVADLIAALDQDGRKALRSRQVRLGPVLVFIPALNKPAAVRLRALLWGLYNDRPLPAAAPKDGVVSFEIDPAAADRDFYRAVGYPVFGSRAIRIDMLDRVISAVYDSARDGKFRAEHKMAEWLGCSIDGLYGVLESMGHRRVEDQPAAEKPVENPVEKPAENPEKSPAEIPLPAPEIVPETAPETPPGAPPEIPPGEAAGQSAEPVPDSAPGATPETPAPPTANIKPELALFRLARGGMSGRAAPGKPARPETRHKGSPAAIPGRKHDANRDKKPGDKRGRREDSPAREHALLRTGPGPRPEDSPFAILEQLRKKADE